MQFVSPACWNSPVLSASAKSLQYKSAFIRIEKSLVSARRLRNQVVVLQKSRNLVQQKLDFVQAFSHRNLLVRSRSSLTASGSHLLGAQSSTSRSWAIRNLPLQSAARGFIILEPNTILDSNFKVLPVAAGFSNIED